MSTPREKARVLFVCTGNSCRSQMAEGFLRHLFGDRYEPHSAGLAPSLVQPRAIAVMREVGVDIGGHTSKSVEPYLTMPLDYVITVCDHANESCPVFTGTVAHRLHWSFEDPVRATGTEDAILAKYREVRDLIKHRINGFFPSTEEREG